MPVDEDQLFDLLYQALDTEELGGVSVHEAALACARHDDVRREWDNCLVETGHYLERAEDARADFGLSPTTDAPGRRAVRGVVGLSQ